MFTHPGVRVAWEYHIGVEGEELGRLVRLGKLSNDQDLGRPNNARDGFDRRARNISRTRILYYSLSIGMLVLAWPE